MCRLLSLLIATTLAWGTRSFVITGVWRPKHTTGYDPIMTIDGQHTLTCETNMGCTLFCDIRRTDGIDSFLLTNISARGWPSKTSFAEIRMFLEARQKPIHIVVTSTGTDDEVSVMWRFRNRVHSMAMMKQ